MICYCAIRFFTDTNSTMGGENEICGSLGPLSTYLSGIIGDVPGKYCSSSLTLMDLTKAVEMQVVSGQSSYLIMQDGHVFRGGTESNLTSPGGLAPQAPLATGLCFYTPLVVLVKP